MYNINVLIAEDEDRLRKLVAKYLRNEKYEVFEAADGKEAIEVFEENPIDLVILDVMMPKIDGWKVCKNIRQASSVPIVMLTAMGDEADKLRGFELGVDDYVTKPFSTREVVARVKALLKRSGVAMATDERIVGKVKINDVSRRVMLGEEEIALTPKEYDMLVYFVDHSNQALTRQQLLNRIWGYDFFGDDRTVDTVVKRLRKKLQDEGERIQTVRGVGYRFE